MRTRMSHQLFEVEVITKATGHEDELLEALSHAQKYFFNVHIFKTSLQAHQQFLKKYDKRAKRNGCCGTPSAPDQ